MEPKFPGCAERAGRFLATQTTMKAKFELAGFVDVQEHLFKCPIEAWPKDKTLKEAGESTLCTGVPVWKGGQCGC